MKDMFVGRPEFQRRSIDGWKKNKGDNFFVEKIFKRIKRLFFRKNTLS